MKIGEMKHFKEVEENTERIIKEKLLNSSDSSITVMEVLKEADENLRE